MLSKTLKQDHFHVYADPPDTRFGAVDNIWLGNNS